MPRSPLLRLLSAFWFTAVIAGLFVGSWTLYGHLLDLTPFGNQPPAMKGFGLFLILTTGVEMLRQTLRAYGPALLGKKEDPR